MRNKKEVLKVAKEGADKYFSTQMDLLEKFSTIDCGSKNEIGNKRVIEILEKIFKPMGVELEYLQVPGLGTHLIGRLKPVKNTGKILILAHLDTVFPEGAALEHPFRIEGEWAYGLGIADCKGGLLTAIYAVKILQEADMLPDKEIIFLLNCDEEIGSPSSKDLFRDVIKGADYAFAFEPTREQNGVYTSRAGVAEGTIDVIGKTAHAQLKYFEGSSATVELANLILKMVEKNDESIRLLYNVAPIKGGERPGIVAGNAHADFCVTLTSTEAVERAKNDVKSLEKEGIVDGCEISTSLEVLFPPMERTEGNQKLYQHVRSAGESMGLDLPEGATFGSGDACFSSYLDVPTVDCLGPFMCDIHNVNERMRISSLTERTTLFSIVLATL